MNRFRWPLAILLIAAQPSNAQPSIGQPSPDRYEEAVAARRSGDPSRAVPLLQEIVAAQPQNADAHLQLGLALLSLERLGEAEAAFRRTLELAPDYADARIGLARVAQRRGDRAGALASLQRVDPANPEARQLREALAGAEDQPQPRLRVDLDFLYSALDAPSKDWREANLRVQSQVSDATALGGAIELSERFGRTDTYGELRVDHSIARGSGFYLLAGLTPDAAFRPRWQLGAGGFLRVVDGLNPTVVTVDARQARYPSGDIQTLSPGVEQYVLGGRAWLSARWINIFDERGEHRSGFLVRGDAMPDERLRIFAGLADAPDVSAGVVVDTLSLFGGLSYDVTDRHAIRLSIAHEDREIGSDRLQLAIGLGARF